MRLLNKNEKKATNDVIGASRHKSKFDTGSINHAIERAINDEGFVSDAIKCIESLEFPAYKNDILHHLKKNKNSDRDIISLFESIDGYIQYKDLYHIRKSLEQNIPKKKLNNQISDQKRQNPDVRIRETRSNKSTKDREAVNLSEERKDYPEVTPTAMSVFICSMCGKEFQNRDDLVHHKQFESGGVNESRVNSRLDEKLIR
jgi:hypothetical protein